MSLSRAVKADDKFGSYVLANLKVVNVIATANLSQSVDLAKVGRLPCCLYDLAIYHCAYLKSPDMYSKVSIFATGKMISIGTKDERQASHDLRYAAEYLAKYDLVEEKELVVKIQNMVATTHVGFPMDLEHIAQETPHMIYEPEQFPGAIYRPDNFKGGAILFFASGKFVIAGATSMEQLENAAREIARLVEGTP